MKVLLLVLLCGLAMSFPETKIIEENTGAVTLTSNSWAAYPSLSSTFTLA